MQSHVREETMRHRQVQPGGGRGLDSANGQERFLNTRLHAGRISATLPGW
jgi:hypothetical protein